MIRRWFLEPPTLREIAVTAFLLLTLAALLLTGQGAIR